MLKVKVINRSGNLLPSFSTVHSAGVDLRANLDSSIVIRPMDRVLIPTGLFIEIPEGFEAQIRPRSGLAINYGITVLNSPGTIDADYRGEVKVILINLSDKDFTINHGDRICQMVFNKYERFDWELSDELGFTERGIGGFGHTGKE